MGSIPITGFLIRLLPFGFEKEQTKNHNNFVIGRSRLPLPGAIHTLFADSAASEQTLKEASSDGRVRTFAHERGNWASYVHIQGKFLYEFF